jgi:hypothetical protein
VDTLKDAIRKSYILDGNFGAILDGKAVVRVTAVLDRTAVYELKDAPWVERHLARLERLRPKPWTRLRYRENKAVSLKQTARDRGALRTHLSLTRWLDVEHG